MSETQTYKISITAVSVARVALHVRERQLEDWLKLEPKEARLRSVIEWELANVRAAIIEFKAL